MDSVKKETLEFQAQGYNCAETVVNITGRYYIPEIGFDLGNLVTGFGGGIGRSREEACGALTGSVVALSMLIGRDSADVAVDPIHEKVAAFRELFIKKYGCTVCSKLREGLEGEEAKKMCHELTADTVVMLFGYLETIGVEKKS